MSVNSGSHCRPTASEQTLSKCRNSLAWSCQLFTPQSSSLAPTSDPIASNREYTPCQQANRLTFLHPIGIHSPTIKLELVANLWLCSNSIVPMMPAMWGTTPNLLAKRAFWGLVLKYRASMSSWQSIRCQQPVISKWSATRAVRRFIDQHTSYRCNVEILNTINDRMKPARWTFQLQQPTCGACVCRYTYIFNLSPQPIDGPQSSGHQGFNVLAMSRQRPQQEAASKRYPQCYFIGLAGRESEAA